MVDVETANPSLASICPVGIAPFRDGVPYRPQQWLVNPQDYFDTINVSIHGIDEETVRRAPTWPEVHATIAPLLIDNIVVSHTAVRPGRSDTSLWNLESLYLRMPLA